MTDVFVNFFWATINYADGVLYILSGHEDEPTDLDTCIYSVNLQSGATLNVTITKPAYTFDHIYYNPSSQSLYSVSQGVLGGSQWAVVSTNPATGTITKVFDIESDNFASVYGGGILQSMDSTGFIYHTFHNAVTDALELLVFDVPNGGSVIYRTHIDTGLNSRVVYSSLIALRVRPTPPRSEKY